MKRNTSENMWNADKAVIIKEIYSTIFYTRNDERSQINNLITCPEKLKKK